MRLYMMNKRHTHKVARIENTSFKAAELSCVDLIISFVHGQKISAAGSDTTPP